MRLFSVYCVTCQDCGKSHESPTLEIRCDCGRLLVIEWRGEADYEPEPVTISERYEAA
jgi:ribosomal protein S27E